MTPESAIREVQSGNMGGLGVLYTQYHRLVRRWVRLLPPEDRDDFVQNIFLLLPKKIRTYDPDRGPFTAWLSSVVRSQLHIRSHPPAKKTGARRYQPAFGVLSPDFPAPSLLPEIEAAIDVRSLIARANGSLTGEMLRFLDLRLAGHEPADISQVEKIPIRTVRRRLEQARRKLQEAALQQESL